MSTKWKAEACKGVLTFAFTRSDRLNAVDLEMLEAMIDTARTFEEDDDLRVLVFAAEGRYFTSGLDVVSMGSSGPTPSCGAAYRFRYRRFHDFLDHLEAIEKPVVLAAQGTCLGLGVELGSSCDFRFASDKATFRLPEIANMGMIPGSGGISRLTRLIGPHWTKWLVMANETIDAEEARRVGYIHGVYPADRFPELVRDFAARLAEMPRECLGLAKLGIDLAVTADRRTAREFDRVAQSYLLTTDEQRDKLAGLQARLTRS